MRRVLTVLLLAFPIVLSAQHRFGEKIEVKLIEVDAVVTDAKGNRIYGLTADDFEVLEGRTKQQISNFSEYRSQAAQSAVAASGSQSAATVAPPPAREPHSIMVLIDALPRKHFIRQRAMQDLEQLLGRTLHEGDRASVIAWMDGFEHPQTVLEPTNDLAAVHRAIREVAGTVTAGEQGNADNTSASNAFFNDAAGLGAGKGPAFDPSTQNAATQAFGGEQDLMLLRRKCSSMQRLVSTLAAQPGKKTFIYASQSFKLPAETGTRSLGLDVIRRLVKAANAAGVTIYAIRPYIYSPGDDDTISSGDTTVDSVDASHANGFSDQNQSMEALQYLTLPTGGAYDSGTDGVATVGNTIVEDLESYYSLAYRAHTDGGDHERKITVRTKNPAYRVRNRSAFVEKSNETMARDALIDRLFAGEGSNDLAFQVAESPVQRTGRNRWLLPIVLKIPTAQLQFSVEGSERVAHVKILIAAAAGVSEITPITDQTLRIVAGKHDRTGFITYETKILGDNRGSKVSVGVFDAGSGMAGFQTIDNRNRFQ